ncbi:hypothetical protein BpHYR1_023835 [Brachionus plicatilis]|uniref:Uncharacterized protein n=1 Tax=Brachionus plicatilis TaxID=10195 RepID=A0A3M7PQ60_BRAPC|nr:hypothetical protein BpHYR1_023835 [Brachionus plicatilis]
MTCQFNLPKKCFDLLVYLISIENRFETDTAFFKQLFNAYKKSTLIIFVKKLTYILNDKID